jgi:O-acetyl-ADP-ribose deacetylase (regulator of RNase III)
MEGKGVGMRVTFETGDIVDETTEALISTGNVHLNMSGGVNGELLLRGGENMQRQLHEYLRQTGLRHVQPGFVMEIGPDPTRFRCVVYTVAVDGFYGSSVDLVVKALTNALDLIASRGCQTVAVPALATGYGPLGMPDFAKALHRTLSAREWPFAEVRVVLRHHHDLEEVRSAYGSL